MKRLLIVLLSLSAYSCHPALADTATDSSACYLVTDPDARAYCRAKVNRESATCYVIKKQDMRAQCLAETR